MSERVKLTEKQREFLTQAARYGFLYAGRREGSTASSLMRRGLLTFGTRATEYRITPAGRAALSHLSEDGKVHTS